MNWIIPTIATNVTVPTDLKLGKLPARTDAVRLKFATYMTGQLPTPPASFGHDNLVKSFPMFGNDQYGDCVWAGAGHETQIWTAEGGAPATFSNSGILAAYSAVTGFNRNDPNTDQGTDMQAAASYRRKTGILDSHRRRHKVGAYVALTPGDLNQLYTAMWLFGAVGIGIEFPAFAMDDFNNRQPWDVSHHNTKIEGGHYIPVVGHHGLISVVTWGREIGMTEAFYQRYNDETIAYLSPEMLTGGVSLEGFNLAALQADLAAVTHA